MPRAIKPFEYLEPSTVAEACRLLAAHKPGARVLAGGTDVLVSLKKKRLSPKYLVYIKNIPNLDKIEYSNRTGLKIGALATHRAIAESPLVQEKYGLLAAACGKVGTPQIRNMGTIGGNLCMAGPSQDTPAPLLVLGAKLKLKSADGARTVPIEEFFTGPFKTVMGPAELLTEIVIPPLPAKTAGAYLWKTKVTTVDESLVGVAVLLTMARGTCKEVKIGLSSVAPTAIRARKAEQFLAGKKLDEATLDEAAEIAAAETRPRSRADYRRHMTGVLVRQAIEQALGQLASRERQGDK